MCAKEIKEDPFAYVDVTFTAKWPHGDTVHVDGRLPLRYDLNSPEFDEFADKYLLLCDNAARLMGIFKENERLVLRRDDEKDNGDSN